ncbi:hypothetical protein BV898_04556 [Hypsibius exemplaris]|uniref:non-specific serine/threonine protein kinase n=1 Tax=Hypsibius exemplaris TaxID=2072580 RepID=A0A1W0X1H4_HYPEX|nr:hypothetical protein BV898_04556 [Hypsibius exemplaris]
MPDELKILAAHCLKTNPDDRPTAAILLSSAYRASLMQKVFDLRETAVTAMIHDEDKSSSIFIYTFKDCYSDLEFGFRRIPAGYAHQFHAHGVFGIIYTVDAFHSDDGEPVKKHAGNQACRLLLSEYVCDARSKELESLLGLEHPNILQYIVIGHASRPHIYEGSHYCLLMERCSGITLRDFIESNPTHCSTERILKYTTQVASGLHYLHEGISTTKFVHGDITSSSIMLKESTGENLMIIDIERAFKQPRGLMSSKKEFNVTGSYYFMSPEMWVWLAWNPEITPPTPDSPTDIYSLGCVIMDIYFASQGQALWPDYDEDDISSAMESEHPLTPRIPENLPDELKVLTRHCLQINPSDRPTGAVLVNQSQFYLIKLSQASEDVDLAPIPLNNQAPSTSTSVTTVQSFVNHVGPSQIAIGGGLAPTASVIAVSSELTSAPPGSGVAPHHVSPYDNPSSSQPAQQQYFRASRNDQAGQLSHQQSETLELKNRIGNCEKLLIDVLKEFKELRDKIQNGYFQSAHSQTISKNPVLVRMLLKENVPQAIREGMRELFSEEEMRSSVLLKKNINNTRPGARVLDDLKLSKLREFTNIFTKEKNLTGISETYFRKHLSQLLQDIKRKKPKPETEPPPPATEMPGPGVSSSAFIGGLPGSAYQGPMLVLDNTQQDLLCLSSLGDDIHTKLINKNMLTTETNVEDFYLHNLMEFCVRERAYKENVMWRARLYGGRKLVQKGRELETPSCDTLSRAFNKLASV